MGKVALGVAGRWTSRSLPKATVADNLRKRVPEPHKPNAELDRSPSFYNKIGKIAGHARVSVLSSVQFSPILIAVLWSNSLTCVQHLLIEC
jgi:hypothetical protein